MGVYIFWLDRQNFDDTSTILACWKSGMVAETIGVKNVHGDYKSWSDHFLERCMQPS
jgi:hypothetical protein